MKATTGETIAFARQVFAGPLEDRIKQLEARNSALVSALEQAALSINVLSDTDLALMHIDAALQQEATQ